MVSKDKFSRRNLQPSQPNDQNNQDQCANNDNCADCNDDTSWSYLNELCISNPGTDLLDVEYDSSQGAENWYNGDRSMPIILKDLENQTISLYDISNGATNLCEWVLKTDNESYVTLNIENRSSLENIVHSYTASNNTVEYGNKRTYEWGESSHEIEFYGIDELTLRVRKLSEDSNYNITISQELVIPTGTSLAGVYDPLIITICFIMVLWLISIILTIVMFIGYWKNLHSPKQSSADKATRVHIKQIMDNMKYGIASRVMPKKDHKPCDLWSREFEDDSKIHFTNEWFHTFHSEWLEDWYYMLRQDGKFYWPTCRTENTEDSKQENTIEHLSSMDWGFEDLYIGNSQCLKKRTKSLKFFDKT